METVPRVPQRALRVGVVVRFAAQFWRLPQVLSCSSFCPESTSRDRVELGESRTVEEVS